MSSHKRNPSDPPILDRYWTTQGYNGLGVEKCKDCIYSAQIECGHAICCDYILITGHRRPCHPGRECTVQIRKTKRKSKMSRKASIDPVYMENSLE